MILEGKNESLIKRVIIIIILSISPLFSFSTHIVGGSLTYVHNGGSSYTVTLKLYKDCGPNTAGFPGNVNIVVRGNNGSTFSSNRDISMSLGTVTNVPSSLDPCAVSPNPIPCVQEGIYTTTVTNLPPNPGGYHMYYQIVARNLSVLNINGACNCIGESFYAYIPGSTAIWLEDFNLPNNTTVDNGVTAWSIANGTPAPTSSKVTTNRFEFRGANNGTATWSSEVINITANTTGVDLSVDLSENGNIDFSDSILVFYRLNGGPQVMFATNGFIINDFANTVASQTGVIGNTVQIEVRVRYGNSSPSNEKYRIDNVLVSGGTIPNVTNPEFNLLPPLFLCVNQPFSFDHSASDVDGDSLFYSLYTPYDGDNGAGPLDPTFPGNVATFTPIVFLPGYSTNNPLGGTPLNLNPNTGLLTGIPTILGQFVLGIRVQEYRNGVYISETLRDFQFNVLNCPQPNPPLAGTDLIINDGCSDILNASGFITSTMTWTSIAPGNQGDYDSYLSCTSGCSNPTVQSQGTPPAFVDFMVCGTAASCNNANICDTVRVTFNPTLNVTITPTSPVICFGQTSTTITANGSGGTPPYSYLWNNVNPSQSNIVGAGTFTVMLSDASGCPPAQSTVTVVAYSNPITANAGVDDTVCITSPVATLNASVSGASGGVWSGGNGTFSPNNTTLLGMNYTPTAAEITAGFVDLTLTTTGNGTCPLGTDVVRINYLGFIGTVDVVPINVSCFGNVDGSASVNITGGISPFSYLWNTVPAQNTITATGLPPGSYQVIIQNGIGCTTLDSVTITEPDPLALNFGMTDVTCFGGNDGVITATAVGGNQPYTYLWSPGGETTPSINNQQAGYYSVTVTDARSCTLIGGDTIVEPTPININFIATGVSCFGGNDGTINTVITGGSPLYTTNWTPSGGSAPNASGLIAGTYILTVNDNEGCIYKDSTIITEPALAVSGTEVVSNVSCPGVSDGSITITPAGGTSPYTYLWSPGGETTIGITNQPAGNYTYTIVDDKGCSFTDFAIINDPLPLVLTTNQVDVTCAGGNNGVAGVSTSGGTPGYTYLWIPGGATTSSINNLTIGTYNVTVTDNNGCQMLDVVNIVEPTALSVNFSSTSPTCFGGNDGGISVTPSGGTSPYTYLWLLSGEVTANLSSQTAGNYTVLVTDDNGCTITGTGTITDPTQIVLNSGAINSSCGVANGLAYVSVASGGTAPFSYLWSPVGGTSDTATGLFAGLYTVIVTDASGCTASANGNVNDNASPAPTISTVTNVSCNGGSDGTASITLVGGVGPFTYLWSPSGSINATATGLPAGIHTVTITGSNGCQSSISTPPITEPDPIVTTVSVIPVTCNGGNDGGASAVSIGGTPGFTYQWLPGASTGNTVSNLTAGIDSVKTTDNNGCIQTTLFNILEPALLTAGITSLSNVNCTGGNDGTATINTVGGTPFYSYNWSPIGGSNSIGTGLTAGNYVVDITDVNNCLFQVNVAITEPALVLSATSTVVATSCFGGGNGSATINPVGGTSPYTYLWSPFGGTSQTENSLSAGNYTVLVNDDNGCATNVALTVIEPSELIGTLDTIDPSCGVSNGFIQTQISGGSLPYSYLWNPGGAITSSISGLSPGTYSVDVTDNAGCLLALSANLAAIPTPVVTIPTSVDVSCFGGNNGSATANITSGTPPYSSSWAPFGGNNITANSLIAGWYYVNVIDNLGCTATDSIEILEPTPIVIGIDTVQAVSCNGGANGLITVVPTGGTGSYTYSWSPNVSTQATASNLNAGLYIVTVADNNACTKSISVMVTEPTLPLSSSVGTVVNPTCFTSTNGTASIVAVGGTIPYTYAWSNGQTGSTIINLIGGTYYVDITDVNGCFTNDSVIVIQPNMVVTNVGLNDTICLGSSGAVTAAATGGNGPYSYSWQPTGVTNSGTLNITPIVDTEYTVVAYDQNGCPGDLDTVYAIVINLDNSNISTSITNTPICLGQQTNISVQQMGLNDSLTFTWNNGLGNGKGPFTVSPTQATTYIVTATNFCGASVIDSVVVDFSPLPILDFMVDDDSICDPGAFQFFDNSVTGNPQDQLHYWSWDFGDGNFSQVQNPVHSYAQPGNYQVVLTVTTGNGCTINNITAPLLVSVFPTPVASFNLNTTDIYLPNDVIITTNTSTLATLYNWSFGDGSTSIEFEPEYLYTAIGNYEIQLIASNEFGCKDTAVAEVTTHTDLVVPNAFTPNNGGASGGYYDVGSLNNDIFFPYTSGVVEFKFEIFNRWGELVFVTIDFNQGWDGYYKGELAQKGVYIWKIYAKLNNGKIFNKTGDVTLLR